MSIIPGHVFPIDYKGKKTTKEQLLEFYMRDETFPIQFLEHIYPNFDHTQSFANYPY